MKNRYDFLKGMALAAALMLCMGATVYTTYRGKFVGDGSGLTGVSATATSGVATALSSGASLTNVTVYGTSGRSNWTLVNASGLLNTNTNGGYITLAQGTLTASTKLVILTNGEPPAPVNGAGTLWNSNRVLYWVTSTKTNVLSDGF